MFVTKSERKLTAMHNHSDELLSVDSRSLSHGAISGVKVSKKLKKKEAFSCEILFFEVVEREKGEAEGVVPVC